MKWKAEYKKTFLKELSKLPLEIKNIIEDIAFGKPEFDNPFNELPLEKMSGYKDKYKIRSGNYRIGLTIHSNKKIIEFSRVAHRKDIYKIFP